MIWQKNLKRRLHKQELLSVFFVLLLMIIGSKTKFAISGVPLIFADAVVIGWTLYKPFPLSILPPALFLILGTLGLPVFASGLTGIEAWSAKTSGYLAGYLLLGFASLAINNTTQGFLKLMTAGLLLYLWLHLCGMAMYVYHTHVDFETFLKEVFIPFLPFGITKTITVCAWVFVLKSREKIKTA